MRARHAGISAVALRYGLAVGCLALAVGVYLPFRDILDPTAPFLAAVMAATWFAGRGPGILTAILATLLADFFLVPPFETLKIGPHILPRLAVFGITALLASWASDARRRAEESLEEARDDLDRKVNDRTASLTLANQRLAEEISERRRVEEASAKAQAELARVTRVTTMGELAASIAHEINQPLAAVVTNASACRRWLAATPPNLPEALEAIQRIISDGNRAAAVIARTRALMAKSAPEKKPIEINDVIRETLDFMDTELRKHRVLAQTALEPTLPTIVADRVQLQQVLLNLILNGVEAMAAVTGRPRTILVSSSMEDSGSVAVAVQDSGSGLTQESSERLFEAFFSTKPSGLGMGLSISRSIIEAHGGRLWAIPNAGPGATMRFTLPLETPAGEHPTGQ